MEGLSVASELSGERGGQKRMRKSKGRRAAASERAIERVEAKAKREESIVGVG